MSVTVLSVATRAVLDACAQLGLDPDAILVASGLSREQVADPDSRISPELADAVWRTAYETAGVPDLALKAAAALPFGSYKVIDFVVANAPTVGEGLARVARYFPIVDPRGTLTVAGDDPVALSMSTDGGEVPPPGQQYTFAALVSRSRASSGAGWPLEAVEFTFEDPGDTSLYASIFDCPIRFGRPQPRLLIPATSWNQPVAGADAALFSVLDDHAQRLLAELPQRELGFTETLRAQLRAQLRGGTVGIAEIGKAMGMSERTLQRRLEEQGLSFSDVLSEVRHELGREYLREPDVSIAEVAWLLGFSDQSAFGRAFKRWTGTSPGAWRTAHA